MGAGRIPVVLEKHSFGGVVAKPSLRSHITVASEPNEGALCSRCSLGSCLPGAVDHCAIRRLLATKAIGLCCQCTSGRD